MVAMTTGRQTGLMPNPLPAYASPVKLLVAVSGGGTTLRNLLHVISSGRLAARVVHVVASRDGIGGVEIANEAAIPWTVLPRAEYETVADYGRAFFRIADTTGCDLVVMGGFLAQVEVPPSFENRVLNIHPSLIPAFCGKGYYGLRVHRAVLERGCRVSGCTAHLVDNEYDHGPIIDQRVVAVEPHDTPESLAARVFDAECELYPTAIAAVASGTLTLEGRRLVQA